MAVPEYRDEVLISLSSVDPPASFAFPERRIFLSKKRSNIEIGRTSKRNATFEAAKCNTWFDSPVMSRKHALFTFDGEKQRVFLKDTGSLHGTYKNDVRLETNVDSEVLHGDKLKFGAIIERGMHKYPPCTVSTSIKFGSRDPHDRGNCFRVPDESDLEDECTDDQVRNSYEMLRSNYVHPASSSFMIDLTKDERYAAATVREDATFTTQSDERISQLPNIPLPQAPGPLHVSVEESLFTSPKGQFSDIEDEDDDVSQPISIADTRSPFDQLSEIQSELSGPSPVADTYDDTDAVDDDEDFSEQDEFENEFEEDEPDATAIDSSFYSSNDGLMKEAPVETPMVTEDTSNQFFTAPAVACSEREESEAEALSACAAMASQQSDSVESTQLHKAQMDSTEYIWKSDLPPVASNKMPSLMKLPSLTEAIPFNKHITGQTTAEIMGTKTGKHDFFNAREVNKVNALVNPMQSQTQTHSVDMAPRPPFWVGENHQAMPKWVENTKDAHDDRVHQLATSDLATCGTKFLDTPLQPSPEVSSVAVTVVPALDDSSAYKFQESKKALGIVGPIDKVACETVVRENVTDAVNTAESSGVTAPESTTTKDNEFEASEGANKLPETPRSSKRKAADISVVTPEERRTSTRERLLYRRPAFRVGKARAVRSFYHGSTAVAAPPPHKRLRRMAEVVGYAALGGVAVMSALIATAPSL